jgi:phage shock protein A
MNKHEKARSSNEAQEAPPDAAKPTDARMPSPTESRETVQEQLAALRQRIAALKTEIDAIAIEAHSASGASPRAGSIQAAKELVADKRDEIHRLNARLEEIEHLLAAG